MALRAPNSGEPSIQRQAQAWVLKIKSGHATPRDAEALRQWCAADAAHAQAFERARTAWDDIGQVGRVFRAAHPAPSAVRGFSPRRRIFLGTVAAAGSAAAVAAMVSPPLGLWPSVFELDSDYRTATGEQRQVALASGINVDLNTQSSMKVRTGQGRNEVELVTGEAAISSQGAERPLEVVAGNGRLLLEAGDVELRLTGGSICVTCVRGAAELSHPARTLKLRENEQVTYDAKAMAAVRTVDPAQLSAWRDGALVFRDTLLSDAVAEINRYRPGRVVLLDGRLGERKVSGKFRIARLDLAIDRIEEAFGARVRRLPGGWVLLS